MYSLEKIHFVIANDVVRDPKLVKKRKWQMRIGEWLAYFVEPVLQHHEFRKIHNIQVARSDRNGERLSEPQFKELSDFQETTANIEARRRYFKTADHTKTLHGFAPQLVETVLSMDKSVKSVLNVGCSYAYLDHVMAQRHPEIQFYGVDSPANLLEQNSDISAPNLEVISGYGLDVLESRRVVPDLCYFSSTAVVIRNAELKAYFRSLAETTKYLVLNEPIYSSRGLVYEEGYYDNPDDIDADGSYPTFAQVDFLTGKRGYLSYLHNYRAIAEQCGFEALHYRVFVPSFTTQHVVALIAKNKNSNLWR